MDTCIALRTLVVPERSVVSGRQAAVSDQKSEVVPAGSTLDPQLSTLNHQRSTIYVQAGAGIVADSVPSAEYEETLNKARGMLKAIEVAERQVHVAN
jgi:anthranilate/para-aminobenzoate synthase component I